MPTDSRLIIVCGLPGSGKTTIAEYIAAAHPEIAVFRFDTIGVPSAEVMRPLGPIINQVELGRER